MFSPNILRLTCAPLARSVNKAVRLPKLTENLCLGQQFASKSGGGTATLRRDLMGNKTKCTCGGVSRGLVAGISIFGLGTTFYYGLGGSKEADPMLDEKAEWPQVLKDRVRSTYLYFGGKLLIIAAAAHLVSPGVRILSFRRTSIALVLTGCAVGGAFTFGLICTNLPYTESFSAKQLAWILHCSMIGAVVAPITILGGRFLIHTVCTTGGILAGLTGIAVFAPSEKFINTWGPVNMSLGAFATAAVLPPFTLVGSIPLYTLLALFATCLLQKTQEVIKALENQPVDTELPFDPINNSITIFPETMRIYYDNIKILTDKARMLLPGASANK